MFGAALHGTGANGSSLSASRALSFAGADAAAAVGAGGGGGSNAATAKLGPASDGEAAAIPAPAKSPQRSPGAVPACDSTCSHPKAHGWCHMPVHVPGINWPAVMNADPDSFSSFKVAPGYDRLQMPHGLQVLVVENPLYLPHAIKRLRASMEDPVIAIDLEWRPQFGTKFTPVAMVQLATSRVALLVRTCRMQYRLAAELVALLTDPTVTILGFSWASADEAKMQRTFGLGAGAIPGFLDLQLVAHGLGWNGYGLARLTNAVLGSPLPKSKRVSMSNWESRTLTRQQVKYAALDVLIAGQVFRGLRLWHRSPSPCATCFQPLGVVQPPLKLVCSTPGCGREFGDDLLSYASHCRQLRHQPDVQECAACGCLRHVAAAAAGVQPLAAEPPLAQAVRASDAAAPPAAPQQQRADGGETGAGRSIGDDSSSGGSSDSGGAVDQASASESAGRDEQELKQHQEHKQRQKEGGWGNVVVATLHGVRATAEESATVAVRALASIGPSTWSAAGHVQGQSKQQHTVRPEQVAVGGVNSQEQQKKGRPRKRKRPASDE